MHSRGRGEIGQVYFTEHRNCVNVKVMVVVCGVGLIPVVLIRVAALLMCMLAMRVGVAV